MVSLLRTDGTPWRRADTEAGVAIQSGEASSARADPELVESPRGSVVVILLSVLASKALGLPKVFGPSEMGRSAWGVKLYGSPYRQILKQASSGWDACL